MQHLHLTCPREQLFSHLKAFSDQLKAVADEVSILDYGYCQKSTSAYLVLEWLDEVDEAFITQLDADTTIVDFCVYSIPCLPDDVPFALSFSHDGERMG